jgi:hypothetical protein
MAMARRRGRDGEAVGFLPEALGMLSQYNANRAASCVQSSGLLAPLSGSLAGRQLVEIAGSPAVFFAWLSTSRRATARFIQSFGEVRRAAANRRAIFAEMPALPFNSRDRVTRVVLRRAAAADTATPARCLLRPGEGVRSGRIQIAGRLGVVQSEQLKTQFGGVLCLNSSLPPVAEDSLDAPMLKTPDQPGSSNHTRCMPNRIARSAKVGVDGVTPKLSGARAPASSAPSGRGQHGR